MRAAQRLRRATAATRLRRPTAGQAGHAGSRQGMERGEEGVSSWAGVVSQPGIAPWLARCQDGALAPPAPAPPPPGQLRRAAQQTAWHGTCRQGGRPGAQSSRLPPRNPVHQAWSYYCCLQCPVRSPNSAKQHAHAHAQAFPVCVAHKGTHSLTPAPRPNVPPSLAGDAAAVADHMGRMGLVACVKGTCGPAPPCGTQRGTHTHGEWRGRRARGWPLCCASRAGPEGTSCLWHALHAIALDGECNFASNDM